MGVAWASPNGADLSVEYRLAIKARRIQRSARAKNKGHTHSTAGLQGGQPEYGHRV